jgi:uroporphyrinogen-III synthase
MRLLVTRPEDDASLQAAALTARGHEIVLAPLLQIWFEQPPLDLDGLQAVIVTSRNALRALERHPQKKEVLELPIYAVGEATARAAVDMGFLEVAVGSGNAAGLAQVICDATEPGRGALLHLSGEDLAFDLASALPDYELRRAVIYRAVAAKELPGEIPQLLREGKLDGAILMSPRTATTLVSLLRRHDVLEPAARLICYCLSKAVAEAASPLGAVLRVPGKPREEDILALIDAEAASS